ncbi:M20/M25/M40 family metallo-hydrolase [Streptomyces noursei]|uniref:M20/M25/M40 family metallo-hydrolase n=1 Tax=Streptomyces noursei TaxID=1971 RepID=UPI00081C92B1|nr:acetylornithine deacetylase/succinyldiaminopimelate desuccinylase-like deacylase [Streptomyces noursei ATCC 11455]MCZ0992738.1 M20/M25/M40 family metallo-hydrolase [Streptomyces noursei]
MAERELAEHGPGPAAETVDQQALDEVVRFTSELIRIDTSNAGDGSCRERPAAEYVAERLTEVGIEPVLLERTPGRTNVVARIEGSDPSADALLVHGHLDVVPAEPADWRVHPFSGEVRDGVVWGRGAIDMKNMDAMMLAVVRQWARSGARPRRDIVLAFTADEEASAEDGSGFLADHHADLFEGCTEGISESGAFTFHAGGGMRIYPIAAGERGTAWLKLTARGRAGHGSKVNRDNAVSRMADAVSRIGAHAWPVRLTPTVRAALRELAALHGIDIDPERPDFDVDALLDKLGPSAKLVEPTIRNSANPTMLSAGYKVNVIPGSAVAHVDGRVVPGGEAEFRTTMDELTGPQVTWDYHHGEVALQAPVDSPSFAAMRAAIERFDPDGHTVPYCMSGGTDAKQFSRLGIVGYGFSPLKLPEGFDYQALFHGVDERVPVEGLHFGVRVLDHFLRGVPGRGRPAV